MVLIEVNWSHAKICPRQIKFLERSTGFKNYRENRTRTSKIKDVLSRVLQRPHPCPAVQVASAEELGIFGRSWCVLRIARKLFAHR